VSSDADPPRRGRCGHWPAAAAAADAAAAGAAVYRQPDDEKLINLIN